MSDALKVLIVDDDPVVLEVARARLEAMGFEAMVHDRGFGTNRMVLKTEPHIVLLDVGMPGLDGDQLVDLIQENQWESNAPWPAVILHSGMDVDELEHLVRKTDAAGAIAKTPITAQFNEQFRQILEELTRSVPGA